MNVRCAFRPPLNYAFGNQIVSLATVIDVVIKNPKTHALVNLEAEAFEIPVDALRLQTEVPRAEQAIEVGKDEWRFIVHPRSRPSGGSGSTTINYLKALRR